MGNPTHGVGYQRLRTVVGVVVGSCLLAVTRDGSLWHMIVASTRRNVSPIYVRTERTRFGEFLSGWHLGSNFFTLKICPDRRKIAPNSSNISKFGLRWVALTCY
jgi:hypothetical protein